jgi:predicted nucleic acid-binding Zn ribbon protein
MSRPDGELFTVVVRGPGKSRWGIVVRAPDEAAARASVDARGHTVDAVRPRGRHAEMPRLVLGGCVRCGYSLARLPGGAAGEVMCPECGVINVPGAEMEERREVLQARRKRARVTRVLFYMLVALVVLMGLLAAVV